MTRFPVSWTGEVPPELGGGKDELITLRAHESAVADRDRRIAELEAMVAAGRPAVDGRLLGARVEGVRERLSEAVELDLAHARRSIASTITRATHEAYEIGTFDGFAQGVLAAGAVAGPVIDADVVSDDTTASALPGCSELAHRAFLYNRKLRATLNDGTVVEGRSGGGDESGSVYVGGIELVAGTVSELVELPKDGAS